MFNEINFAERCQCCLDSVEGEEIGKVMKMVGKKPKKGKKAGKGKKGKKDKIMKKFSGTITLRLDGSQLFEGKHT